MISLVHIIFGEWHDAQVSWVFTQEDIKRLNDFYFDNRPQFPIQYQYAGIIIILWNNNSQFAERE